MYRCVDSTEGVGPHGNRSPIFYCRQHCQKQYWQATHKADCKSGELLQVPLQSGKYSAAGDESHLSTDLVRKISEAKWIQQDVRDKLLVRFAERFTVPVLEEFSDEKFPDERAKRAMLSCAHGRVVAAVLGKMLERLLRNKKRRACRCGVD
jgi:hypothetical protein